MGHPSVQTKNTIALLSFTPKYFSVTSTEEQSNFFKPQWVSTGNQPVRTNRISNQDMPQERPRLDLLLPSSSQNNTSNFRTRLSITLNRSISYDGPRSPSQISTKQLLSASPVSSPLTCSQNFRPKHHQHPQSMPSSSTHFTTSRKLSTW